MRLLSILSFALLFSITLAAQETEENQAKKFRLQLGLNYDHAFTLHGFVRVREFELQGDKLEWEQLGMNNYALPGMNLEAQFGKGHILRLQYERLYFFGGRKFNRNIEYNGTIIDASKGIDLSPSTYKRLSLEYRYRIKEKDKVELWGIGGFIYDYFTIYLNASVSPLSERNEVYEAFDRQAFPFPYLGLRSIRNLNESSALSVMIRGSYIPSFESPYYEGGRVRLEYHTLIFNVDYQHEWKKFEFRAGTFYRSMYLLGESEEDSNEYSISSLGIGFGLSYKII